MADGIGFVDPAQVAAALGPDYDRYAPAEQGLHARLLAGLGQDEDVAVAARSTEGGGWSVVVCTWDRVGLLSVVTGLLSAHGVNIRRGDVLTLRLPRWRRAAVLDVFEVAAPVGADATLWDTLRVDLEEMVALMEAQGAEEARARVVDRVAGAMATAPGGEEVLPAMALEVDNEESATATVVRLHTLDTAGFLFELSNALAVLDVNIERMEVRTVGDEARDTLWVTDAHGRKITQPARVQELKYAAALIKQFTHLLPRAPNRTLALRQFGLMTRRMLSRPDWAATLHTLGTEPVLETAARLLGASRYLWEDFLRLQHENLFPVLCDLPGLDQDKSSARLTEELRRALADAADDHGDDGDDGPVDVLNRFKDREMFRVDLRHITGRVDLRGFGVELTALADVVVTAAAELAYAAALRRHSAPGALAGGEPCGWVVLALGKAGGRELGFASDVELLFVYGGDGETARGDAHNELFTSLVQEFLRTVHTRREGTFEIDLRLRPHGRHGPLATTAERFADYFRPGGGAAQYERMALVRMRRVTGDEALASRVLRHRDAWVYGPDPVDVARVRELRARQVAELVEDGTINAKYSPGGLVDVEYHVQIRQMLAGRDDPSVRVPGTREAIGRLHAGGHLGADEAGRLEDAYVLLRRVIDAVRVVSGHARRLELPEPGTRRYEDLARRLGAAGPRALQFELRSAMGYAAHLLDDGAT